MVSHYKDRKVVVIGLARSGRAAAHLLENAGAVVIVTDYPVSDQLTGLAKDFF